MRTLKVGVKKNYGPGEGEVNQNRYFVLDKRKDAECSETEK